MFIDYMEVIDPLIGLASNVLIQNISFRYSVRMGLLKSIALGFIAGLFSIIIIESYIFYALQTELITQLFVLLTNLFIYTALGYGYFSFVNLLVSSMRIRILMELYESKEGLSQKEIFMIYNGKEQFETRINRLMKNGQILHQEGKYYLGSKIMLIISKIVTIIKLVILGEKPSIKGIK